MDDLTLIDEAKKMHNDIVTMAVGTMPSPQQVEVALEKYVQMRINLAMNHDVIALAFA